MPIYEFRCESCAQVFEHLAMGSKGQLKIECPHCGSEELSRVLSSCAAVVKGQGAPGPKNAELKTRSCENSGNCTTLTLPGPD